MYAGLGLVAGAVFYFGYNKISQSMKVAAIKPQGDVRLADTGKKPVITYGTPAVGVIFDNKRGRGMGDVTIMEVKQSWNCANHPNAPGCNPQKKKVVSTSFWG